MCQDVYTIPFSIGFCHNITLQTSLLPSQKQTPKGGWRRKLEKYSVSQMVAGVRTNYEIVALDRWMERTSARGERGVSQLNDHKRWFQHARVAVITMKPMLEANRSCNFTNI
jgi:hypothetical protein